MKYTRLYADAEGETHFEDVEVPMSSADLAPPAPPVDLSEVIEVRRCAFLRAEPGWFGDWHPAPARQFLVLMSGRFEVETSDGEVREFGPGDVVLAEDLEGKGHVTRSIGDEAATAAVIQI